MIIDKIIGAVFSILNALLGLLPVISIGIDLTTMMGSLGNGVRTANAFFPVFTLGVCLAVIFTTKFAIVAWTFLVWLYDQMPFKAS